MSENDRTTVTVSINGRVTEEELVDGTSPEALFVEGIIDRDRLKVLIRQEYIDLLGAVPGNGNGATNGHVANVA